MAVGWGRKNVTVGHFGGILTLILTNILTLTVLATYSNNAASPSDVVPRSNAPRIIVAIGGVTTGGNLNRIRCDTGCDTIAGTLLRG